MKILGLDLSLTSTGLAVITDQGVTTHTIKSKPAGPALLDRCIRIQGISATIGDYTEPGAVAVIEGPSYGQHRQAGQHDRAGLWWAVVRLLLGRGVHVVEVPPATRAMWATGRGNAAKDQVLAAIIRRYGHLADIDGNDEADALALATLAAWHHEQSLPGVRAMPSTHLRALDKIAWPDLGSAA